MINHMYFKMCKNKNIIPFVCLFLPLARCYKEKQGNSMLTNTVTKVFNMKPWNIFKFQLLITQTRNPDFHKHTKLSIFALSPTLYIHIFAVSFCIFYHMMLVTVKLDRSISRYKRITFQGCRFLLSSSFPMARSETKLEILEFLLWRVCENLYYHCSMKTI